MKQDFLTPSADSPTRMWLYSLVTYFSRSAQRVFRNPIVPEACSYKLSGMLQDYMELFMQVILYGTHRLASATVYHHPKCVVMTISLFPEMSTTLH